MCITHVRGMRKRTEIHTVRHREESETSKSILEVLFIRNIPAINMKCLTELGSYFMFGMLYTRITLGPILCCF